MKHSQNATPAGFPHSAMHFFAAILKRKNVLGIVTDKWLNYLPTPKNMSYTLFI